MKERSVEHQILLACSHGDTRLFKVHTGQAWVGKGAPHQARRPETVRLAPGDVVLRAAQPIKMGLCNGGSDLIGWHEVAITPEMVGRTIAVFAAVEVKNETGRLREDQVRFLDMVRSFGGIAGMARSPEEALTILSTDSSVAKTP